MLRSAGDKGLEFGVAKKNTVRLCTNDIVMAQQQQLPLLLLPLQHGKVAELLLWWVLVWSRRTYEFLK